MADFYAARAGTNAGAPLDGFLTAVHNCKVGVVLNNDVEMLTSAYRKARSAIRHSACEVPCTTASENRSNESGT